MNQSNGPIGQTTGFFVISGSHGVGKTTTVALVLARLQRDGCAVAAFHHRLDKALATPDDMPTRPSLRRTFWQALPAFVRALIIAFVDERRYAQRIVTRVGALAAEGNTALADRYVYDRLVDLRLNARPWAQRFAVAVSCRLMPRPTLTFVLTDEPGLIFDRKPELSIENIDRYQTLLIQMLRARCVPHRIIAIEGRPAETVAAEIADSIAQHVADPSPVHRTS